MLRWEPSFRIIVNSVNEVRCIKKKNESMKKADKRKKLKVYYIDVQDFALLAETLHIQQICKCTFVHCVSDLLYPVLVKLFSSLIGNNIIPHKLLTEHF